MPRGDFAFHVELELTRSREQVREDRKDWEPYYECVSIGSFLAGTHKFAKPRTIAGAGRWIADGVTDIEVLAGAVARGFMKLFKALPSIDQILIAPTGSPVPTDPAALYAVTSALLRGRL